MGTTSSINPGLANLLQNLSNVGSPLLSSPQALAALQKASPADIVQLSAAATQLEGLNALLGVPDATSPNGTATDGTTINPFASLEAAVASASAAGTTPSSSSGATTPTLAAAIASYEGSAQSGKIAALFGTDTSTASTAGTSFLG